jgi:hypothetical protein
VLAENLPLYVDQICWLLTKLPTARIRPHERRPVRSKPLCYPVEVTVSVDSAAHTAFNELAKLIGASPPGLRLEEVEFDDSSQSWLITLGYLAEDVDPNPPVIRPIVERKKYERVYKVFRIDGHTGAFRAMKIRQP